MKIEYSLSDGFYYYSVGIWLLPRSLWYECGGYDEEMIYMNDMEINMINRLTHKYKLINLGRIVGYDFYHLEHYHPWVPRKSSVYRRTNAYSAGRRVAFHPNKEYWGLQRHSLMVDSYPSFDNNRLVSQRDWRARDEVLFLLLVLFVKTQIACDNVFVPLADAATRWNSRRQKAWMAIRGEPILQWPHALLEFWRKRGAAHCRGSSVATAEPGDISNRVVPPG
jgi:hypothetical protein